MPRQSRQNITSLHPSSSTSIAMVKPLNAAEAMSPESIAKRAYEKFVGRGAAHGQDREDWAAATEELKAESAQS